MRGEVFGSKIDENDEKMMKNDDVDVKTNENMICTYRNRALDTPPQGVRRGQKVVAGVFLGQKWSKNMKNGHV